MRKKGLIAIYILELLHDYSDEDHKLTQKQIIDGLFQVYRMDVSRGTLSGYLNELRDEGYIRGSRGIYGVHFFSRDEVRVLMDGVLFGRQLSSMEAKTLLQKLERLLSYKTVQKMSHVSYLEDVRHNDNHRIYAIMDRLDEAIDQHKKVKITSCRYDIYGRLRETSSRVIDPYYIVSDNARYYLICHNENSQDLGNKRLDRIARVEICDEPRLPIRSLPQYHNGFDLRDYMREHIYMFAGDSDICEIRIRKENIGDFIDWYGMDYRIVSEENDDVIIRAKINTNALYYWIIQYGGIASVEKPLYLREKVAKGLKQMLKKYEK